MNMKHIGTKILAGVLVVLLAGAGVLIWRNLPEDAPRLQEPEETVRQEPEVQPDTTATLCVAGDIVAHMPLVADAWNGGAYDFTHLFADARRFPARSTRPCSCCTQAIPTRDATACWIFGNPCRILSRGIRRL